jgi:NDP-sugar pyrophosphorylase family protein
MNAQPTVAPVYETPARIATIMRERQMRHIPLVDADGVVVGLECLEDLIPRFDTDSWVVLMAGGRGVRLRPLTDSCPKPLLKVGDKPVLEMLVEDLVAQGFRRIFIAVNYMAEMVRGHFGDGSRFGASIEYLVEDTVLGTAGALTLLPELPKSPTIVMNADLITKLDFRHLLRFHSEEKSVVTMCVRKYDFQVPYGVVHLVNTRIEAIEEKPIQEFFVNAGIYVLSPQTIAQLPKHQYLDMPNVIAQAIADNKPVGAFPIMEYWIDIGKFDDYQQAQIDMKSGQGEQAVASLSDIVSVQQQ